MWFGKTVPLTFVLTPDLAGYLADAVDAKAADGDRIDIRWDRPISMQGVADIATRLLGQPIKVRSVAAGLLRTISTVVGTFAPGFEHMGNMVAWFETGKYVAHRTRQAEVFDNPPTAEDAVARARALGHDVWRSRH